jgi:acyl-CoA reductase-like NAD-dependent aldehyde dehydrogenase
VVPQFAELLAEQLQRAGFPDGVIQVLPATREMGPILADAGVDHIVFTGSAPVGRKLAARLGEKLITSTLELSGCDAQFVLEDADVELAARAAWFGSTLNHGQTCIAVRRAFVQRSIYPAFCDVIRPLCQAASPLRLAMPSQVRQAERMIEDARKRGARPLNDGPIGVGESDCRPTVLVDASADLELCREAAFAPLLAVIPFDSLEEGLEQESHSPFALAASVFTRNVQLARKIAARLRSGCVTINEVIVPTAHPGTPFGGRGESGWGVTQGAEGLLEMTVPQTVSMSGRNFRPHYEGSNPDKQTAQAELLRGLLEASHAPSLTRRARGWWQVIRRVWRGV